MEETTTETPAKAATVSVPAWELRRALTAVMPHRGLDDTLPSLACVRLETSAGWLYLAATDRYTIGVARMPAPGADGAAVPDTGTMLPPRSARSLRRWLKGAGGHLTLGLSGTAVSASGDGESGSWQAGRSLKFPDWRPLLHGPLTAGASTLGDGHGADPGKLARFSEPCSRRLDEILSIRVTQAESRDGWEPPFPMLLVTRGEWFLGAMMPMRCADDAHAAWTAVTAPLSVAVPAAEAVTAGA